jgi:transcription initiation factor TFIIIB Brf1 subunit/transcription initiation factor TFIIB
MTCKECGCLTSSFDERLGETVCDSCGLVEISHFIEDTVANWKVDNTGRQLGSQILKFGNLRKTNVRHNNSINMSDRRMSVLSATTLSQYSVSKDTLERVRTYYRAIKSEYVLKGHSIEERSAGLTYFILRELGIATSLRKHQTITDVPSSRISKVAKKIARFHRKAHIFSERNIMSVGSELLDKLEVYGNDRMEVLDMIEYVNILLNERDIRYSDNFLASTVWMVSQINDMKITQKKLVSVWNCSDGAIRVALKQLYIILGITKAELDTYSVNEIIHGIRI